MQHNLIFIIFITLLSLFTYLANNKLRNKNSSLIERFKKKFKSKYRQKEKALSSICNALMKDPEKNIAISSWENNKELKEKADIHRARLNKFGKSKMNNEMLYLGPKGGIYKLTSNGNRQYI